MTTTTKYIKPILLYLVLIAFYINASAQYKGVRTLNVKEYALQLEELRAEYGKNKKIPTAYEVQILTALSYFDELKEVKIDFVEKKIQTTMAARPRVKSLFANKSKKGLHYQILINNSPKTQVPLSTVSFNGQVGVIGHELCHILEYEKLKKGQILKLIFQYPQKQFKEEFEKDTDLMTIKKLLGWQLYDCYDFILNGSNATDDYKARKRKYYLEPDEIIEIIGSY